MAIDPGNVWRLSSIHILSLLLGVLGATWSPWPWTIPVIGLCLAAASLAMVAAATRRLGIANVGRSPRHAQMRVLVLALAWALAGAAWAGAVSLLALRAQLPASWEGRELRVSGQIVSLPIVETRRSRFLLQVDEGEDQPPPVRGRLLQLAWYDDFDALAPGPRLALQAGAHWQLQVRLRAPRGLRNPGGFDAERSALAQRWAAVGLVRQPQAARQTHAPQGWAAWRERMSARIGNATGGAHARFIQALAVGDTRGLDAQDWRLLRSAGLTHLIAISGFHVGLVALAAAWLVRGLWRLSATLARRWPREHAAAVAAVLAAALYGVMAGGSLPTVRTVLMIAVLTAARLCRRPVALTRSLALALVAVLLVDPLATLLPGFWLSFGGVACLTLLMPQNAPRLRWLWEFLRAQWVATLCLLPVSAAWFAQASWVGPLVNLLAIPWWSLLVVPLSLGGLAFESAHAGAGAPMWRLAAACFAPSWRLFSWLGAQPFAQAPLTEVATAAAVLALLGATGWLLPRGTPGKPLAAVLWLALAWPDTRRPGPGAVELVVLDVGQGLAVLVRTHRHALLYDAGPRVEEGFDAGERVVVPALHALGVRALDALVVSHADSDHAGGVAAVMAELPVARTLAPPDAAIPGARAAPAACLRGQAWEWDGVRFRFLHPPRGFPYLGNESSCVLRVEAGGQSALLTGDIGRVIEQRLLRLAPADLRAELVVVPHHGSANSSSAGFVAATGARLAIFSSGHGNRFGHPRPGVVRWWRRAGAEALETARSGAVRVWLGPAGLAVREQRRWQARHWDAEERLRAAAILSASKQAAERAGGSERVGTGQGRRLADGAPAVAGDPGAGDRARAAVDAAPQ
ncbi:MAG TPA: DNA internalization-related competence protein ComEC/Rec2 [Stenotrophomonas sp.]|nr:DNA internalization-related competence protein ComEC/Rec2 [Stenotrophomonas sp.]